jgi:glycosyltransferase involved in cell wall biosynthesis
MNKTNISISVCIASYNGGLYIKDQLNSILSEIESNDELIIVDDCSKDNTVEIIKDFNDDRIKIYQNETNRGHVYTFAKAIEIANNDLIFLSDQDDIWEKGRINTFKHYFEETNVVLISSNFSMFNDNNVINMKYPLLYNDSSRYIRNIYGILLGKRAYFGCAMAFRKILKDKILPIPNYVESHDLWIALAANIMKSNLHIEEITLRRRIHDNNVTNTNRKIISKIKTRFYFMLRAICHLNYRIRRNN